jgi:hypothetical protein
MYPRSTPDRLAASAREYSATRPGYGDLILELYRPEAGEHARMAVGMAALPLNTCVTIAAEVAIKG